MGKPGVVCCDEFPFGQDMICFIWGVTSGAYPALRSNPFSVEDEKRNDPETIPCGSFQGIPCRFIPNTRNGHSLQSSKNASPSHQSCALERLVFR